MQQLQLIAKERASDQQQLNLQTDSLKSRQQYDKREKSRYQRQNWIVKLLKSLRNPSIDMKKQAETQNRNIYHIVRRIMGLYIQLENNEEEEQLEHFTEEFINLFVWFFNLNREWVDPEQLRLIVRPNNVLYFAIQNFVMIDLIRSLVDYSRNRFKKALSKLSKVQKRCSVLPPSNSIKKREQMSSKCLINSEQSRVEENSQNIRESFSNQKQTILYEKYNRYIVAFNPEEVSQKVNQVFISLLNLNLNNRNIIAKYKDDCFGKKRNIAYNFTGLYSQQQINNMVHQLNRDVLAFQNLSPLNALNTAEDFKERFRMCQELQERKERFHKKKLPSNVNQWICLRLQQSPSDIRPFRVVIVDNLKESLSVSRYKDCHKQPVTDFLQQKLNERFPKQGTLRCNSYQRSSGCKLKKQLFFDFNRKKLKQLLMQDRIMAKKDILLPIVRNGDSRENKEREGKIRQMSHQKLIPLPKYQLNNISKRANTSSCTKIIQKNSITIDGSCQLGHNFLPREKHLSTYHI